MHEAHPIGVRFQWGPSPSWPWHKNGDNVQNLRHMHTPNVAKMRKALVARVGGGFKLTRCSFSGACQVHKHGRQKLG